jgi:GNAT superfamily N-acetyltransferase
MNIPVQHLNASVRATLREHFLALPSEDKRLRFGSTLSDEAVAAYVERIDFDRDAVFGVHDDRLALVGVAHLGLGDGAAELGLSVVPAHRGRGIGSALFERAAEHARNRFVGRLFMYCLKENGPIMRIATRNGMDIVTDAGDADAHLELPSPSAASITGEIVTDRFALFDYALKAHVATWKAINAVLDDAGSPPGPVPGQA